MLLQLVKSYCIITVTVFFKILTTPVSLTRQDRKSIYLRSPELILHKKKSILNVR